jgi:hypothetical protein
MAASSPKICAVTNGGGYASVTLTAFHTMVMRPAGSAATGGSGGDDGGAPALPVILSLSQTSVQSDVNGMASLTPSTGGFSGPLEIQVVATAGTTAALRDVLQAFPAAPN